MPRSELSDDSSGPSDATTTAAASSALDVTPGPAWPRRMAVALVAITALLAALYAAAPVTTNDLFWHIETGEHLWTLGRFPEHDVFSYTATDQPWFLHEWLTQLCFYGLHEIGGFHLLRGFTAAMALAILFVVWQLARRLLAAPLAAAISVLAFAILGTCRYQTRPTLFSMLLFLALVSWLVLRERRWRFRDSTCVVAVTVLWVNLHSVGLLAPIVYGGYVAGIFGRRLIGRDRASPTLGLHALTLAATFAATLANPHGLHLYAFAFQDKSQVMNFIADEWGTFHFAFPANADLSPEAYAVILAVLAVVGFAYLATGVALNSARPRLRSPAIPDPVHLAMLILCLAGGLMARRFHWMLAPALILALHHVQCLARTGQLDGLAGRFQGSTRSASRILAAGLAWGLLSLHYHRDLRYENQPLHAGVFTSDYIRRDVAPSFDIPAVRFLKEAGLSGNAFCHYGSGGILSYYLYPDIKVFIDSRADLYRRRLVLEFLAVRDGRPDQQEILDRHDTDIYVRHWDISTLREPAGWTRVFTDGASTVWLRKNARNADNLARVEAWQRARRDAGPRPDR